MRLAPIVALAVLAGCPDNSRDGFPVRPGGGGGGGGELGPDAPLPDAGQLVQGRVCVIDDLRVWDTTTACADTGFAGLTVTIGASTAMTAADGTFAMIPPVGNGLVVVTGPGVMPSTIPFDPAASFIRAVAPTAQHWTDVETQSQFALATGTGAVIVAIKANAAVATGATAVMDPQSINPELYDTAASSTQWDPATVTGPYGQVIFHGILPDIVTVTATASDGINSGSAPVTALGDSLSFETINIIVPPP
jgi:hypothetical protein